MTAVAGVTAEATAVTVSFRYFRRMRPIIYAAGLLATLLAFACEEPDPNPEFANLEPVPNRSGRPIR